MNDSVASYLNPIVKNAYKPFGWGVDEAVEALEESARMSDGGGDEAGLPHVLPPDEEPEDDPDNDAEDAEGASTSAGKGKVPEALAATTGRAVMDPIVDPEQAAIANGKWHEHGSKRKLNRLPGAKEPLYPACYPPSKNIKHPGPDASLEDDLEYMIDRVESAPSYDFPFKSYTYFCDIWPPHLWESLHRLFPPTSVFDRLERNVKRQVRGTGGARKSPYQRYQLNAQEIAGRKRSWRSAAPAG